MTASASGARERNDNERWRRNVKMNQCVGWPMSRIYGFYGMHLNSIDNIRRHVTNTKAEDDMKCISIFRWRNSACAFKRNGEEEETQTKRRRWPPGRSRMTTNSIDTKLIKYYIVWPIHSGVGGGGGGDNHGISLWLFDIFEFMFPFEWVRECFVSLQ